MDNKSDTIVESGSQSRDISPHRSASTKAGKSQHTVTNIDENEDAITPAETPLVDVSNPQATTAIVVDDSSEKGKKPQHWLEKTEMKLPKNNLPVVMTGIMLTVFLAALDQTICATALPTIAANLHSNASDYSWVGSAYLLASTAVIPLYGRMSDLIGRKRLLYFAIILFLFGSAMCGAAQSSTWLSICRGVQGLGGGGIISLANILIGDLVSLKDRGSYAGLFGFVWGLASVLGPILGGVISQHTTWRWIFFLNLPIGGIALAVLFFFLNLNQHERKSAKQVYKSFDTIGYLLVLTAIVIFLLGFTFAETNGFAAPRSIACIVVGAIMFPVFTIYEVWLEKHHPDVKPLVPPRLFRTRTTALILVGVAMHAIGFFAAAFYLPLYYQAITGSDATLSAVQMLPFSLVSALISALSGYTISHYGRYRIIIWSAFGLFTLGMGLMTMLDADTPVSLQEIYPLIVGIGLGPLFQGPLVALTAAMPPAQMAVSVASYALVRSAAGTVGITVAGAIFNAGVQSRLKNIPDYTPIGRSASQTDLKGLIHIQPPSLAKEVVGAYGDALRVVWIVLTPLIGIGFLCSLGIKGYSLNRVITKQPGADKKKATEDEDVEKQATTEEQEENDESEDSKLQSTSSEEEKTASHSLTPELETLDKTKSTPGTSS